MSAELAAGLGGVGRAVGGLKAAAAKGFTVSEAGGQALIKAIDNLRGKLDELSGRAAELGQEPALGQTPAARVYRPFLATVATDPDDGLVAALRQLSQDLQDARDAITASMASYQQTDQDGGRGLRGLAG
ncbi:hypothetical protein [Goodfellowiella coeruleoviolacea]|uniref:Uncharacterized protein n=1 Tax=Goodfellowiella coeruleoviolacea TaxID=334858 RepID=A0AAE3GIV9_9PSEU|nr:hypothetical protein [Goodfellowiella coeruleoviolacea]MCP2169016.1 hypothetical protein [Goodfellowiella coeruleoviolacea]